RKQDYAGADSAAGERAPAERGRREPAVGESEPAAAQDAPQRHARDQHRADDKRRALATELGVRPGTERAGRDRRTEDDRGTPPVEKTPKRRRPAGIGEQGR